MAHTFKTSPETAEAGCSLRSDGLISRPARAMFCSEILSPNNDDGNGWAHQHIVAPFCVFESPIPTYTWFPTMTGVKIISMDFIDHSGFACSSPLFRLLLACDSPWSELCAGAVPLHVMPVPIHVMPMPIHVMPVPIHTKGPAKLRESHPGRSSPASLNTTQNRFSSNTGRSFPWHD